MTPLVSILIPVRDEAEHLAAALRSLSEQTLEDFEALVVDDGSSDASAEIAREYARGDARFRVLEQPPLGIVAALERARAEARGRYVARMDGDDVARPRRLELQVAALEKDARPRAPALARRSPLPQRRRGRARVARRPRARVAHRRALRLRRLRALQGAPPRSVRPPRPRGRRLGRRPRREADDPALERELRAAEDELERLTRVLNALLTLAREGDRPELREPAPLARAVEDAYERWLARAEHTGHELELERGPDTWVRARPEDLAIVLDNLVENALHYAPAGTRVVLTWDGGGRLAVLDEGPGVPAGEERAVFERFRRGRSDRSGTGLGLAIVETLARRWGGSASLANRDGGGARVEVVFPVETVVRERVP